MLFFCRTILINVALTKIKRQHIKTFCLRAAAGSMKGFTNEKISCFIAYRSNGTVTYLL